jgi:hypothetical protein
MSTVRNRGSRYIRTEGPKPDAVRRGLGWLLELGSKENKKSALVAVPVLDNLSGVIEEVLGERAIKALKQGSSINLGSVVTVSLLTEHKDVFNHQGPVLAVYPNKKLLDKIDNMRGVTDVLVIPWSFQEIVYWIETWQATELGSSGTSLVNPSFSDPVVEEALKSLTSRVNLSTGISHPMDKAAAVDLFRKLKAAKITYDPSEVRGWLVRHGWESDDADAVKDISEKVSQGRAVRSAKGGWADDIVKVWRERASKS